LISKPLVELGLLIIVMIVLKRLCAVFSYMEILMIYWKVTVFFFYNRLISSSSLENEVVWIIPRISRM